MYCIFKFPSGLSVVEDKRLSIIFVSSNIEESSNEFFCKTETFYFGFGDGEIMRLALFYCISSSFFYFLNITANYSLFISESACDSIFQSLYI